MPSNSPSPTGHLHFLRTRDGLPCPKCFQEAPMLFATSPAGPWACFACRSKSLSAPHPRSPWAADDPFLPEGPPPPPWNWRHTLRLLGVVLLCLGAWGSFWRLCGVF